MGFHTPILFSNDAFGIFDRYGDELLQVLSTMCGDRKPQTIPVGPYSNYIKSLGHRHADESGIFVFMGNTWVDLTRFAYDSGILDWMGRRLEHLNG